MALLLRNGAVFLHIPKTGGSWVRAVCQEQSLADGQVGHMHANYQRTARYWMQYPDHYVSLALRTHSVRPVHLPTSFVFCFVRHPLTWIESWWNFNNRRGWPHFSKEQSRLRRWHPTRLLETYDPFLEPGFESFLRFLVDRAPSFVTNMYASYAVPEVAFVGRFESLAADLTVALELSGAQVNRRLLNAKPPVNLSMSKSAESRPRWPDDLRREILKLEAPALEAYGYEEMPNRHRPVER